MRTFLYETFELTANFIASIDQWDDANNKVRLEETKKSLIL